MGLEKINSVLENWKNYLSLTVLNQKLYIILSEKNFDTQSQIIWKEIWKSYIGKNLSKYFWEKSEKILQNWYWIFCNYPWHYNTPDKNDYVGRYTQMLDKILDFLSQNNMPVDEKILYAMIYSYNTTSESRFWQGKNPVYLREKLFEKDWKASVDFYYLKAIDLI